MKLAAIIMSLSLILDCAVAGSAQKPLPEKILHYVGVMRGYKPAITALRQEDSAAPIVKETAEPVSKKSEQHAGQPAWLLLAAAAAISLAGTGAVLAAWYARMQKRFLPERVPHTAPDANHLHAMLTADQDAAERESADEEAQEFISEDRTEEEDEDVLQMAMQYQRGRGEVELAMRMHSHQVSPSGISEKIRRAGDHGSPADTAALAKKLGVGKGEIALAVRLRHVRKTALHTEEVL